MYRVKSGQYNEMLHTLHTLHDTVTITETTTEQEARGSWDIATG